MSKTIIFLGLWLALLIGCASPAGNESGGTATAVPPTATRHTGETVVLTPTASPLPTTATATVIVTAVDPTATATSTPTIAPTPVPTLEALEAITHPLRSHQTVWFAQGEALWRSDVHGVELDQLTSDEFLDWLDAPEFGLHTTPISPDGRWIAHPRNGLRLVDIGTRQERAFPLTVSALAWSPDSRWLAYAPADDPTRRLPDCSLCLYDLATDTHLTLIPRTDLETGSIRTLVWSPDGAKLAYGCCFTPREPYEGVSDGRIETVTITNGQRQPVGATAASVGGGFEPLCWTPEKTVTTTVERVYVCSPSHTEMLTDISGDNLLAQWETVTGDDGGWEATRLFVTERVNHQLVWEQRIEGDSPLRLAWSPDGRYLFFDDSSPNSPIWRVTADGDNLTEIVPDGYLLGVVHRWESLSPPLTVSPDGRWRITAHISQPIEVAEDEMEQYPNGLKYRAELVITAIDGGQTWTAVDEWRNWGLGYTQPEPVRWSADGRYFFYADIPNPDGCAIFVNGGELWRLDLQNGTLTEIAPYIGLVMALSPDETKLAVHASYGRGFLIRDLVNGAETPIPLPQLSAMWQVGGLAWSPDGRHLLIIQVVNPCGGGERQTALVRVDVDEGGDEPEAVTILDPDSRNFKLVEWVQTDEIRLQDAAGRIWYMDVFSGFMAQGS
jgi:WD40 repeat protein